MKFDVTHNGLGTYDVRLNWETKDKIKKIAYYGTLTAVSVASTWYYVNYKPTDEIESE